MNMRMTVKTAWQQHQYTTSRTPPPTPDAGTLPRNCPLQNKAAPHDSPSPACLRRPLSFNAGLFMRSLVPCLLLYLSSVLWLLRRPPQLLSQAQAYVRGETDLNTVSTVIVPPQPTLPWRTLEQHLSLPFPHSSLGRTARPTALPSPVRYSSFSPSSSFALSSQRETSRCHSLTRIQPPAAP